MSGSKPPGMAAFAVGVGMLCAACAGVAVRGSLSPLLNPDWRHPYRLPCMVSTEPPVPPPEAIMDVAALRGALAGKLPEGTHATLAASFDSTGAPAGVRLLETGGTGMAGGLPGQVQERLRTLDMAAYGGSRARSRTYLVRLERAGTLGVSVGHSEECRPDTMDRRESARLLSVELGRALDRRVLLPEGRQEGEVSMRVGIYGRVSEVRIRNGSGHAGVDTILARAAMQFRFRPALLNREPVPVWVSQRLRLNVPYGPGR